MSVLWRPESSDPTTMKLSSILLGCQWGGLRIDLC